MSRCLTLTFDFVEMVLVIYLIHDTDLSSQICMQRLCYKATFPEAIVFRNWGTSVLHEVTMKLENQNEACEFHCSLDFSFQRMSSSHLEIISFLYNFIDIFNTEILKYISLNNTSFFLSE